MAPPTGRPVVRRREGPVPRQLSHNSVSATTCCLAEWPFLDVAWPVPFS